MEDYENLKAFFKSGRYECDLPFYSKLYQLANEFNLYEEAISILKNKQIVQKIAQLTKKHLSMLEDEDDEQRAIEIIYQINKEVAKINTTCTKNIFEQIEKMGGKSYEQLLVAYVKGQPYKRMYLEILDRIINSVHDPKIRFQDMLTVGLFMSKNNDKVSSFVQIYSNILENGVNDLRKFRQNEDFIKQNPSIAQVPKVKSYLQGAPILLNTLLRFNQLYKLLSGDNKYGLKLNALKKDIQESSKPEENQKHKLINEFKQFLADGSSIPNFCSLCLYEPQDHMECKNSIKLLYQRKNE